uniref:Uncharacterized protein n=1 Tax=Anguilla anguilla TaxID=7936 RepID=A0A0E9QXU9_ANGAN
MLGGRFVWFKQKKHGFAILHQCVSRPFNLMSIDGEASGVVAHSISVIMHQGITFCSYD